MQTLSYHYVGAIIRPAKLEKSFEIDDPHAPSGVQKFCATAGGGSVRKSPNTASTEFQAKKRHTLKIELLTRGITRLECPAGSLTRHTGCYDAKLRGN